MKRLAFTYLIALILSSCMVADAQQLVDQVDTRFQGIEEISVEGVFCDVTVEPGSSDEVHLNGEIRSTRTTNDLAIKTSQNGSKLRVWIEHPKNLRGNVKGFLMFEVPEDVLLNVSNVSGDVKVTNIGSDNMSLSTVSGNINVTGAGANAGLKSVSGNITASVINGALTSKSVSGDQAISNVKGAFTGQSTSGNFSLKMVEGISRVTSTSGDLVGENLMEGGDFRSTSGNIQLNIVSGDLSVKSVSGDVRLSDVTGSLDISTTSGNQQGDKIMILKSGNFNSISGDINMDLENSMESLSFRLKSGSGNLVAGDSRADENLLIEKGDIWIRASSTSGDQTFN
ncbi:DUF4097 family beta strand repeat-containing protein [Anaerophaga thermohalophila]|jgi:DUF4097 and DUF4098 domain-containing protein YvlB|uniref:DUF4097 family beta strand repeat-containing protein n=1 Tax=Anaerophaga thermohalophila TaxID=177400 RepID=UPI000307E3BE|nr:DUF4097 family beta strand repeat-containing protein [Anaerophaga thermohalophila]